MIWIVYPLIQSSETGQYFQGTNAAPTSDKRQMIFPSASGGNVTAGITGTADVVKLGTKELYAANPTRYPPYADLSNISIDTEGMLQADLSAATAATINQLREAFQIQKLYERDARGGTRYIEIIRSHFGVISPDARLQRPEYLGGGSASININPVAQTSSTDSTSPQANLIKGRNQQIKVNGIQDRRPNKIS